MTVAVSVTMDTSLSRVSPCCAPHPSNCLPVIPSCDYDSCDYDSCDYECEHRGCHRRGAPFYLCLNTIHINGKTCVCMASGVLGLDKLREVCAADGHAAGLPSYGTDPGWSGPAQPSPSLQPIRLPAAVVCAWRSQPEPRPAPSKPGSRRDSETAPCHR